ncbi:MAG: hypothetical protein M3360_03985 [Actinomycetota bacterium]|nr:hypothetical protein [Actinomycetota bacterium]
MTKSRSSVLAGGTLVVYVICMGCGLWLAVANENMGLGTASYVFAFTAFVSVGALIVARRPGNALGWIFCVVGILAATGVLAQEYAEYSYITRQEELPGRIVAVWYTGLYWYPLLGLMLVFTLLYFPTGRLLSQRWKPLAVIAWSALIGITVLAALAPTIEIQDEDKTISNPIGIEGVGNVEQSLAGTVLFTVFLAALAGAFVSLVVRFRRSKGEERQQLKWFTYAGVLAVLTPLELPLPAVVDDLVFGLILAFLPIATGIAILKYRLYDIDVIINRTLVYGGLTAILALVYVAGVVVLGAALRSLTGQVSNNLAVAASTLGVAALFRPARARVQSFIDRRFYRRKYDVAKTVESFSSRLREEVDLSTLRGHLVEVVQETMQPAHVSLWLRSGRMQDDVPGAPVGG